MRKLMFVLALVPLGLVAGGCHSEHIERERVIEKEEPQKVDVHVHEHP